MTRVCVCVHMNSTRSFHCQENHFHLSSTGAIKKDQDGNRCSQIVVTWYECIFKQIQSLKDARLNVANSPVIAKHLEALQLHMMCSHPSAQPLDLKSIHHSNTGMCTVYLEHYMPLNVQYVCMLVYMYVCSIYVCIQCVLYV